jgi:predicted CXXCH cytochrome family protein
MPRRKGQTPRGGEFIRQYETSVHFRGLKESGLTLSANCSHCHGVHDVVPTEDPASRVARANIIRTCGRCHVGIEKSYREGVHGKAYVKGSGDVPVCTDCHNEHDIRSPEDLGSRVYATKVAAVCVRCHDDERLGRLYGFLTSRLKTFFSSYHGTASKFGETRVANCASCHGFHDIRASSDPKSSINPAPCLRRAEPATPGPGANFAKEDPRGAGRNEREPRPRSSWLLHRPHRGPHLGFSPVHRRRPVPQGESPMAEHTPPT